MFRDLSEQKCIVWVSDTMKPVENPRQRVTTNIEIHRTFLFQLKWFSGNFCEHFDRWFSRILLLFVSFKWRVSALRVGIRFLVFLAFAAGLVWQHQVLPNDLTLIKLYPCFGYVTDSVTIHLVLKLLATLCGRNYNIQTCVVTICVFIFEI